ncbi:hypothetical protein GLOIN_2v1763802 [Rhizophagus clarus]|uniref:Uncharacterized protein n=1 Tax=Rhizophagus clarus TaxID=94130 RepID=A0A8H3R4T3_9GLOM|nr:hypothetical protein GLOIN_2v1763802 [Rhizophagus clarus]
MSNVHTLKDIEDREAVGESLGKQIPPGRQLGSIRELELEKALRGSIKTTSDIANDYKDLQDVCLKQKKDLVLVQANANKKISQLNATNTRLRSSEQLFRNERKAEREKYSAEIKSLKSLIKTLEKEASLAQKASSADKIKILSLETKVRELEGKLDDLELEQVLHDSNAVGGMIEDPAQSDRKEIDSLRLELERVKEDLNSKEYTIECMEKGKEASDNIYKRELDIRSSERLKLMEKNTHLQELLSKKDNEIDTPSPFMNDSSCTVPSGQPSTLNPSSQIISVGGAEAVSLPATASIIASSSMSPMLIYSILTLREKKK